MSFLSIQEREIDAFVRILKTLTLVHPLVLVVSTQPYKPTSPLAPPASMATDTSFAYRIHLQERGPISSEGIQRNLKLEEVSKPEPGPGQVLVRVRAAALNCMCIAERSCL